MVKVLDDNSESQYAIQVLDKKTGDVVQFAAGFAVERQLVTDLVNRVLSEGVGFFRTEARVAAAVKKSIEELLHELKSEV